MSWSKIFQNIKPALRERINKQSAWLDVKKHLIANFLQRKSEQLTTSQKKTGIIFFMAFGTLYSVHMIYTGLAGKSHTELNLPKGRMHSGTVLRMGESMESINAELAIRNLTRFKHYMDSLKATPGGQAKYDSLTAGRPGMMDSINYIINNQ